MTPPRAAVLLAGGLGTRMHPLTLSRPKHLLPVAGVPVIDLQLRRLADAGVRRVVLATATHADLVRDHVVSHPVDGLDVHTHDEGTPLGTGGALLAAIEALAPDRDEQVVVANGDLLTGHDLALQSAAGHDGTDVVLHVRAADDPAPFGTVDVADDGRRVVGFREKVPGPPGTLVNAGTYVVRPRVLEGLATGGVQSWERDLLPALIGDGALVVAHRAEAWFADIGSPTALLGAHLALLDGTAAGVVPSGTSIDPVSPGTLIADGAEVVRSSTGAGVRVGAGARVVDSILLDDVVVGDGALVRDSVVGAGVVVADRTSLRGRAVADGTRVTTDDTPDDEGSAR